METVQTEIGNTVTEALFWWCSGRKGKDVLNAFAKFTEKHCSWSLRKLPDFRRRWIVHSFEERLLQNICKQIPLYLDYTSKTCWITDNLKIATLIQNIHQPFKQARFKDIKPKKEMKKEKKYFKLFVGGWFGSWVNIFWLQRSDKRGNLLISDKAWHGGRESVFGKNFSKFC